MTDQSKLRVSKDDRPAAGDIERSLSRLEVGRTISPTPLAGATERDPEPVQTVDLPPEERSEASGDVDGGVALAEALRRREVGRTVPPAGGTTADAGALDAFALRNSGRADIESASERDETGLRRPGGDDPDGKGQPDTGQEEDMARQGIGSLTGGGKDVGRDSRPRPGEDEDGDDSPFGIGDSLGAGRIADQRARIESEATLDATESEEGRDAGGTAAGAGRPPGSGGENPFAGAFGGNARSIGTAAFDTDAALGGRLGATGAQSGLVFSTYDDLTAHGTPGLFAQGETQVDGEPVTETSGEPVDDATTEVDGEPTDVDSSESGGFDPTSSPFAVPPTAPSLLNAFRQGWKVGRALDEQFGLGESAQDYWGDAAADIDQKFGISDGAAYAKEMEAAAAEAQAKAQQRSGQGPGATQPVDPDDPSAGGGASGVTPSDFARWQYLREVLGKNGGGDGVTDPADNGSDPIDRSEPATLIQDRAVDLVGQPGRDGSMGATGGGRLGAGLAPGDSGDIDYESGGGTSTTRTNDPGDAFQGFGGSRLSIADLRRSREDDEDDDDKDDDA